MHTFALRINRNEMAGITGWIWLAIWAWGWVGAGVSGWSASELAAADLAREEPGWEEEERAVLLQVNLARMHPAKYWELELEPWTLPSRYAAPDDAAYRASLKRTMRTMRPAPPLRPDARLKLEADCLANQQARTGKTGHDRSAACKLPQRNAYWAENCDYGMATGRDVIAHLLIDEGVPSLGHRENCLNPRLSFLGVGQTTHPKYGTVTVMDFIGN